MCGCMAEINMLTDMLQITVLVAIVWVKALSDEAIIKYAEPYFLAKLVATVIERYNVSYEIIPTGM